MENPSFDPRALRAPLALAPTRVWRTGQGGREIGRLLGEPAPADSHFPEDWIASVLPARNAGREDEEEGLSRLLGQEIPLRDVLQACPAQALGARHAARFGPTTGVLAKIVDTSERTTIQVHPDRETARRLFGSPFGKTESWHVLSVRPDAAQPPRVYLGFREGVTRAHWKQVFDAQNIPAMLACLHDFPVQPGDTFLIEAGVPHAVSADFLFLEMQEPTDFTIRTERKTAGGFAVDDFLCHQGLGFDAMFDCFHYDGLPRAEAERRFRVPSRLLESGPWGERREMVGYGQTPCFRLERWTVRTQAALGAGDEGSALFVYSGTGTLSCAGQTFPLAPGARFFLPACCQTAELRADGPAPLAVFRCFGPAPQPNA